MSTTTARAWLVIANGGGRWTVAEVREKLPEEPETTLDNVVRQMGERGFLKLYEKTEQANRLRFGVTAECRVPKGIANWEVVEAMGMRLRPEIEEGPLPPNITVDQVLRSMAEWRKAA